MDWIDVTSEGLSNIKLNPEDGFGPADFKVVMVLEIKS
ncbi:hypothetical protein FHR85_001136 [Alkalibacillus almallahensis]|nr:hypothetical protein [Alkalibacillus almallahensis]